MDQKAPNDDKMTQQDHVHKQLPQHDLVDEEHNHGTDNEREVEVEQQGHHELDQDWLEEVVVGEILDEVVEVEEVHGAV